MMSEIDPARGSSDRRAPPFLWIWFDVAGAILALVMVLRSWYEGTPLTGIEAAWTAVVVARAGLRALVLALALSSR